MKRISHAKAQSVATFLKGFFAPLCRGVRNIVPTEVAKEVSQNVEVEIFFLTHTDRLTNLPDIDVLRKCDG